MPTRPPEPPGVPRCRDCQQPLRGRAIAVFPPRVRGDRCDGCHLDWLAVLERKRADEYWALHERQEGE